MFFYFIYSSCEHFSGIADAKSGALPKRMFRRSMQASSQWSSRCLHCVSLYLCVYSQPAVSTCFLFLAKHQLWWKSVLASVDSVPALLFWLFDVYQVWYLEWAERVYASWCLSRWTKFNHTLGWSWRLSRTMCRAVICQSMLYHCYCSQYVDKTLYNPARY